MKTTLIKTGRLSGNLLPSKGHDSICRTWQLKLTLFALLMVNLFLTNDAFGQIALRGASSTTTTTATLTITKPTGLTVGDVMIANVIQSGDDNNSLDNATGSGWTLIAGSNFNSSDNRYRGTILYKIAVAADVAAANFAFTLDGDSQDGAGGIAAFSGVDIAGGVSSTPFDVTPGNAYTNIANDNTYTATAVTTATANAAIIMLGVAANDVTAGTFSTTGTGNMADLFEQAFNANLDMAVAAAWGTKATASTTGNGTATLSGSTNNGALLVALKRFTGTITTSAIAGTSFCQGGAISVPFTKTGTYASGNVFTAQLSNASGSFASPINIGTLTSVNAGTISATIPAGQAAGTGYRIRVVSDFPGAIGTDNGTNLTINASATAAAGTPISVCYTSGGINVTAGSSATNNAGTTWTSSGTGSFTNANSMTLAEYTPSPADLTAGSVTLTLTATGNGACTNATSTKTLAMASQPTASAGGSATICRNQTATVSGASSANGTRLWTHNGGGSLSNTGTLTPTYTPGGADGGNTVTLTMTVTNAPCTAATATYTVHITSLATAVSGNPVSTCFNSGPVNITSGATATNNAGILWTHNGTGSIANDTSLTLATYTPGLNEAGPVTLTLTSTGNTPCANATSNKTLTIVAQPTASAGGSTTICRNQTATVSGASSSNGTRLWTHNGGGSLSGASTLTPTYTPGGADGGNTVTLTMTVTSSPCTPATATYSVAILAVPTAVAGIGLSTCSNQSINITAGSSASNNNGITWTHNGTGSIADANSMTLATYTPGPLESGNVTLTLTSLGNAPCANVTSTKILTVNAIPVTTGVVICAGGSGSLTSSTNCPSNAPTSVGPGFAGAGANSGTGTAWTNPGSVSADDNSRATVAGSTSGSVTSQTLNATNFGFAIPANATIVGVECIIGRNRSGGISGEVQDTSLRLLKAGTAVGTNKGATSTNWPSSEAAATYGAANDMWGTTWSVSEINAANFGVAFVIDISQGIISARTANVDYIQLQVSYTLPGTMNWYIASSGGSPIGTGSSFNPVGVAGSGLTDTNTNVVVVKTYYAECSTIAGCRTPTTFTINPLPEVSFTTMDAAYCQDAAAVALTANHAGGTFSGAGITDNGNGTASFNPVTAGVGPHTIMYSYTDENSCPNSTSQNVNVNANITYYADADGDGFGDIASTSVSCMGAPIGYVANNTDCDDEDDTKHATFPFYVDGDDDGFGAGSLVSVCAVDANTPPEGYSLDGTDCNDSDDAMHTTFAFYVDGDDDGFGSGSLVNACAVDANTPPEGYSLDGTDCNDADATMHQTFSFYTDADHDNYGTGSLIPNICAVDANTPPVGYSLNNTDCNDALAAVNPGHAEVLYNGIDDNCDGQLDEGFQITSHVQAAQCATTLTTINSLINAVSLPNITRYRFSVTNMTTNVEQILERPLQFFSLPMLGTYDYATTYSIKVEVQRNGIWLGYYGSSCLVSSPAVLAPGGAAQVTTQCGQTLADIGTLIYTTSLANVTGYRFRITNLTDPEAPNQVQILDRTLHWFSLPMLATYTYGTTYMIEVSVRNNVGVYSGFGSPCTVTTPAVPTLTAASCGAVVANKSTLIYTSSLSKVTSYRFEVTNLTTTASVTVDRSLQWFSFANIPGYTPGAQYGVRVAVMTSGVWSLFGEGCEVTAPASAREDAPVKGNVFITTAYPNPYADSFGLDIKTSSDSHIQIKVYDMTGRLLEARDVKADALETLRLGDRYPSGVYNVIVGQDDNLKTLRVVKR